MWYKQEGELVPFTAWPWMISINNLTKPYFPHNYIKICSYFNKDYLEVYWHLPGMQQVSRSVYQKYGQNKNIDKIYSIFCKEAAKLENLYYDSFQENISDKSNSELIQYYVKLLATFRSFWNSSLFIDSFDPGLDREKIAEIAAKYSFTNTETATLTTPKELVYSSERLLDFLKIVKIFLKEGYDQKDLFSLVEHPLIVKHQQRYDFYQYSYVYPHHLTTEQLQQELQEYFQNKDKTEQLYKELVEYSHKQKKKILEILKKHHLNENPFYFFQKLTYWREHRKKVNMMGIHLLHQILESIEQQTGIQKKYLEYLNYDELEKVITKKIKITELKRRYNDSILLLIKGEKHQLLVGSKAKNEHHHLEQSLGQASEQIRGYTACKGKAQGRVKIIINRSDFAKFNLGDILVTGMTRPEHVPLMKKAAAIVTNEGGITCHAAIISRELGVPCIIGTKIATKALKENDLVEVNADHGIVRKLKDKEIKNIKLIIFDFSGVCFNEEEPPYLIEFAKKHHLPYKEFESLYLNLLKKAEVNEITGEEIWRIILKKYKLNLNVDDIISEMMGNKIAHRDILNLAKNLRRKYKTSYFTNYNLKYWKYIHKRFPLALYFDWGIVSYQVKSRKPAIEGFKIILDHFKVEPEEAIFLDDKESNLVEPAKLGLNTILFKNKKQFMDELKKRGVEVK